MESYIYSVLDAEEMHFVFSLYHSPPLPQHTVSFSVVDVCKDVPLHAMEELGRRGAIALTHS
jgi:hypothetical protein